MALKAVLLTIRGVVQGVGFRPFLHRAAAKCRLSGYVSNTPDSVVVHVEGPQEAIGAFVALLRTERPPGARISSITRKRVSPAGFTRFVIEESRRTGVTLSTIPPDLAVCPPCLAEMEDPNDRRFSYPFINCTDCGPRFTIVRSLPYDRENTSMSTFLLCRKCRGEYEDPSDRRFHAEPVACPDCGPSLKVAGAAGRRVETDDPVGVVAEALRSGKIAAVRGLGGFHLAADATDDDAVGALRERKFREEKPFAVMVRDLSVARAVARLGPADVAILFSPSSPVLLTDRAKGSPLSPGVAPGLAEVGIFLPYTPLHRLLLDRADRPLVMTSGNVTDEPIATGNGEAIERLAGIADVFLLHDREIVQRSDDSVVRRVAGKMYPIRRARGFVPSPIVIQGPARKGTRGVLRNVPVLGVGGEIKSTFCILKEGFAYLSQHIGDLDHAPVRDFYAETFDFFRTFLDAEFKAVCRDLHPGYFTTSFAETVPAERVVPLQHHKAHLYALMAETGFAGKAVGVAFDGTGYGEDGAVWGGEFFAIDGMEMKRAAHLDYFPLQGGDTAVKEPWKSALSLLRETLGPSEGREAALRIFRDIGEEKISLVSDALERGLNVIPSSSCGRLFDAASALAGVCRIARYEGQAPMLLEGAARNGGSSGGYDFRIRDDGRGPLRVDWREVVSGIVSDVSGGVPAATVARRFHDAVAGMVLDVSGRMGEEIGTRSVLLSGGVFQNAFLLRSLLSGFRVKNWNVLIHREVPANDGGISLGQAYFAANLLGGG